MTCDTTHLLIQAELDGELGAADAISLEQHLQTCPGCAALRTDLADLSARLRTGLTRHAAPPTLRRPAIRRLRPAFGHAASFGAGLAVAASLMLVMLRPTTDAGAGLLAAHLRALQPGHLLDVPSTDRHTVKPWFDGRIPFSPTVPDLAGEGFPLIGARLDYLGGHPVAVLVYTRRKHVIDVFVDPGTRPEPTTTLQGVNIAGWVRGGLVYQAVSDLDPTELAMFVGLMER